MLAYILAKMLSLSQDVLLKLSETTSPQKLFPSDCITLYLQKRRCNILKTLIRSILELSNDDETSCEILIYTVTPSKSGIDL